MHELPDGTHELPTTASAPAVTQSPRWHSWLGVLTEGHAPGMRPCSASTARCSETIFVVLAISVGSSGATENSVPSALSSPYKGSPTNACCAVTVGGEGSACAGTAKAVATMIASNRGASDFRLSVIIMAFLLLSVLRLEIGAPACPLCPASGTGQGIGPLDAAAGVPLDALLVEPVSGHDEVKESLRRN